MEPLYKQGDNIICFNWAYFFNKPKKGDIVVAKTPELLIIKRIKKISSNKLHLSGDNIKQTRNYQVNYSQILGKVIYQF